MKFDYEEKESIKDVTGEREIIVPCRVNKHFAQKKKKIIIIIILRHQLGPAGAVSASSNCLFKGLPSRICPSGL